MSISFRSLRQRQTQPPSQRRSPRRPKRSAVAKVGGMQRGAKMRRIAGMAVPSSRLFIVWSILMVGMVGLVFNLFRLQILDGHLLQSRAKAQQTVALSAAIPRRPIIDRTGDVLAIDKPVYTLYAHPVLFQQQREAVAVALAPLLNQSLEQLLAQLGQGNSGIRLAESLSEDKANQIRHLSLDGLELVPQQERLYPQQDLFANIVGYVNVDRQGQAGVEYSQEEKLARALPEIRIRRAGDGSVIPGGLANTLIQHDNMQLKLTVDSRLQRATRFALKQQLQKYRAKRGVVIVMDVNDGSILSMASEPSFDANKYYKTDLDTLRDWVVTDVYEPGSTFKPINLSIALESGAVKPNDVFVDEGKIHIGEWPIQNSDYDSAGGRGPLSVAQILQYSSNVGMVHVMQKLDPGVYYGWLERLKIGEPTGIDLPFESPGQFKSYAQFTRARIEPATTAFGQGFSLTPIKLIQLHSMIANGGKLVTPHVIQGLVDADGKLRWQPDRTKPKQIFTPQTTAQVLKMMEQVVQEGTGQPAQISGFRIAGKTGTAQKASHGGYSRARITSFVGILPMEKPHYAVLAVIDEPQGDDAYGSTVAAPIVKQVMEALISSQRIPPSQPDQVVSNQTPEPSPDPVRLPADAGNQVNQPESPQPVAPAVQPTPARPVPSSGVNPVH